MTKTTFQLIREIYKKAQAEQERKLMTPDTKEHIYGEDSDPLVKPRLNKKQQTVEEARKSIELREKLKT